MTRILAVAVGLLIAAEASALDLALGPDDVRLEQRGDGGYHLYVRKKPEIQSVLLVESTKDPSQKLDNYAYRATAWNPVNGDEARMLDGKLLSGAKLYSLLDSTPEADAAYGQAFHIFVPYVVEYGYAWSRNGRIYVSDGTFFNIRAFAKPYADYSGPFRDNPFEVRMTQRSSVVAGEAIDEGKYLSDTRDAFERLARDSGGLVRYSAGPEDIVKLIGGLLDQAKGKSLEIVICLDATQSMEDDIDAIKRELPALLRARATDFKSLKIGIVLYRDYTSDFIVKKIEFTKDIDAFDKAIQDAKASGGGDIPEAVDEALWAAVDSFAWEAEARLVILIGDAPPHPVPLGKVTEEQVIAEAGKKAISLNVIILPH